MAEITASKLAKFEEKLLLSDVVFALAAALVVRQMKKSLRDFSKAHLWPQLGGPLLASGVAVAIEVLSRGVFTIPNPPAILLLIVVFSAFIGGVRSGLVTALIAWLYFVYFFSIPGQPFHHTEANLRRVIVWAVTTPVMAIMVGILKHRTQRAFEISKENAFLTQQIAERKRTEEATRSAREAEQANQAKSEFLSRMSHELRTPLNAILGFAQLLEMEDLPPRHREHVEDILKGGRHLLTLIGEVLEISRIEAGRLAMSPEPVRIGEVAGDVLDLVKPIAAQRNVRLNGNGAETCEWHVSADRQRLKQVLLNLLSNAIKFNHQGGAVTLSCEGSANGRVRIKVNDTGPGIAPNKMERLFTPFERLGAEQSGIEGTGLGLALSKGLVEAMGGTLGVESTVGRGSTFWVEFSLIDGPVERVEQTGVTLPAKTELGASQRAQIVLYIEDNLSNLKLIQHILAHRPEVRLIPAMQGRLGLDLAREHRPDLILLDLHLPDIAGDEVLRRLQNDPETRGIPVVMISANATSGQIGRLLAAGARDYLTKPLDVKKFIAVLDEVLREREVGHTGKNG